MVDEEHSLPLLGKRIVNKLGRPFGVNPFPRAFARSTSNDTNDHSKVFDIIYKYNLWGSAQSRSGVGSEMEYTIRYRRKLADLIRRYQFCKLFDAPCGDLHWMSTLIEQTDIIYHGGDISKGVVTKVKKKFPKIHVKLFDICKDNFPEADVWHCRDCLFHLPFKNIKQALENFTDSNIPYALLTTHRAHFLHKNLDVSVGGFRFLDLERTPINLPKALCYLQDYRKGIDFPRFVGLWPREDIATALTF